MEEPPAAAAIVRPSQPQLAPHPFPPVPSGGGMDCPNSKRSAVVSELPEDSLAEILARVPIRSLCRAKCVAKTWRDLIEDPFHRKKLPQTLEGFFFIKEEIGRLHIDYVSLLARQAPLFKIDTSLSFLTELPGYETLTFKDSCNGLLLFQHQQESSSFGYVVWNPATKQWGEVSRYGPPFSSEYDTQWYTYLVFDPAISTHFRLVQFLWQEFEEVGFAVDDEYASSVLAYFSETGQWVHIESVQNQNIWNRQDLDRWYEQCLLTCQRSWCALLNGMLHFISSDGHQIFAVDAQGVTQKIIPVPRMVVDIESCYVAQSQGRLHYIKQAAYNQLSSCYVAQSQGRLHYIKQAAYNQLSIWVLEDYDTQEWVLKHTVSFMELFGKMRRQCHEGHKNGFSMVGMHPDGNVVFIVQNWDLKLISYDMDHKLVSVIGTLENDTMEVVSYVPCFLELPALTNKY